MVVFTWFYRYSAKDRLCIAKYAGEHGITRAAKYFSRKLGINVSKTTVHSIWKSYVLEVEGKRTRDDDDDLISLPHKKRGRRLLLGEKIDTHVQMYLSRLRDAGGVITARIAIAAAKGMIYACDRSMLVEFGGHVELNCSWAYSLLGLRKKKSYYS